MQFGNTFGLRRKQETTDGHEQLHKARQRVDQTRPDQTRPTDVMIYIHANAQ